MAAVSPFSLSCAASDGVTTMSVRAYEAEKILSKLALIVSVKT
jgi:hypothetical protein